MAGQNADMTLKVGLDLNFFRQELQKASSSLAGQPIDINVRFNRRSVQNEFNALSANIRRRNYTLEVKTNLKTEIDNAKKLAEALVDLERASKSIGGVSKRMAPTGIAGAVIDDKTTYKQLQALYKFAKEANLPFEKLAKGAASSTAELKRVLSAGFGEIGSDVKAGISVALKDATSTLAQLGEKMGETLLKATKGSLGIASPSREFKKIGENVGKGFELGAVASMDKAFDALERKLQERLKKLQSILSLEPSRRSAFPFVATGGRLESGPIAREIDQAYAQLAQIRERRQERLTSERGSLAQAAGRMLPAGISAIPTVSGRDIVVENFYKSMQDTQRMLQENFAANSYLPRATRNFAASMQQASQGIKAITGARGPIAALPSSEMLRPMIEQRQFQAAITQAIKTDMQNALRQQMRGLMLPSAGQTSYRSPQQKEQQRFQEAMNKAAAIDAEKAAIFAARQARIQAGETLRQTRSQMRMPALPAAGQSSFGLMRNRELQSSIANIGAFGRQEIGGVQGLIASGKGSIFEKLKASAIAFAQNAPTVIKYLNLFRPERISVSDLPSAKEGPGQFIQRISQQFKEGLFGPGTRPAQSRQFFEFGQGAQLPGMPLQKALPPIGGSGGSDRVTGMGQPPQRGGAIVPFAPSTRLPEGYFESAKKYSAALEMARATSAKFTASQLPLIGGLREVASEFGFALKQVLLFGTAYKGLAFVQSLPGQILNAAKSQQQYNNALQTATQDTGTFAKELVYVDNVQRAFGLNLQTTRDGFTKLYASMAPTGFDSGSIEKLFTGISAATAALQLTPDKAERVIYAFGQMASKGQIMSEELKGQLGDVLPGALAIFAKAAGMSVKEFSKAMEDGEFVGQKFRDTFAKVSDELMTRFGTGAQAAGKSLQGLLNTVQGDFARTLESFAPLADAAAQAILGPLGGSLKQLSQSAKIATGEIERTYSQLKAAQQDVSDLRAGGADAKEIKAAEQNVAALVARYTALMRAARDPAIAKQAQDIQRFTEELTKAGTFVMNMAKAIGSVLSPVLNLLGGNLTTVISLLTSFYVGFQTARLAAMALMGALSLYKGLTALLGLGAAASQATALAGAFNVLGVAATGAQIKVVGLKLALTALVATTVIGAVVGGIMFIAGAFAAMRDRASEAAQSSRDAAKAAVDAASTGNVPMAQAQEQAILAQSRADKKALETLKKLRAKATPLQREGGFGAQLTPEESAALMGSELTKGLIEKGGIKQGRRTVALPTTSQMQNLERNFGAVAQEQKVALGEAKAAIVQAQKTAQKIGLNQPAPSNIVEAEAPDKKAAEKERREAEKLANQQQQAAIDAANSQNALNKAIMEGRMSLDDQAFQHQLALIDARNSYELAGLNSIQARQEKFQQDLQKLELDRISIIRKAEQDAAKAVADYRAAENTAAAAESGGGGGGKGLPSGITQYITGDPSSPYYQADHGGSNYHEHLAFASRALAEAAYQQLTKAGVQVTEFKGVNRVGRHTPGSAHYSGLAFDVPGAQVPVGQEKQLTAKVQSILGIGGGTSTRERRADKATGKLQVEQTQMATQQEMAARTAIMATNEALEKRNALIRTNIDTIFPVAEQRLENDLMKIRNDLQLQGMPQEYIKYQEDLAKANYEMEERIKRNKEETKDYENALAALQKKQKEGATLTPNETAALKANAEAIAQNKQELKDLSEAQMAYQIAALESAIATMKNADALKALQETSERINQSVEGTTGTFKDMFKEIAKGGDYSEIEKVQQEL
ncbi:MAG: tape measure protein, partial [Candidatus Nanopelagicaceae bacterium]